MKTYFYDIESLENVYTLANYKSQDNHLDIFYLIDNPDEIVPDDFERLATERIHEKNKNFKGTVSFFDLTKPDSNIYLAKTFGLTDAVYTNDPNAKSSYSPDFRIKCDTDVDYDEENDPYFLGYNSFHYDTTIHTLYLYDTFSGNTIIPPSAKTMRVYNDELFNYFNDDKHNMEDRLRVQRVDKLDVRKGFTKPDFKAVPAVIRKNMLMSGRHLDVARLNEKQSKVGLKRLLGMLGHQILESNKLRPGQNRIETADQLLDLIAYNVSDVVNLEKLFLHKTYQSSFTLKKQLLKTYPELVYKEDGDIYKPLIAPDSVRNDRLTIDSSSAQFATKALCPYHHLHDYDTVSFMYPSPAKAKALGIKRVNVLEEAKEFFYKNFSQPELREKFDAIYNYYKSIEGKNFNEGKNYLIDHNVDPDSMDPYLQLEPELRPHKLSEIPAPNTCMFYYKKDGTPSTCFVNFSTGGIHGAEFNLALYEGDLEKYAKAHVEWENKVAVMDAVKQIYPNPWDLKLNKGVEINGVKYKPSDFLKPKATETTAAYKDYPKEPAKPEPFKQSANGTYKLDARYAFTSADATQHEDFTSYYPNMLRMMDAFYNEGLGYDRYGEIFDNKTKYGKMMKDDKYSKEEQELYSVMRNGTKLILNSASGAGDAGFESNVRMNNKIISMRIIGQLFTWRIGQAQTIEGASITSTNTDGLYSARLDAEENNEILARESADINVEIEPEPIYLISKDSNNRTEIHMDGNALGEIAAANGGSLSCRKGPTPTQSLSHPAILDWALCEYLTVASTGYKGLSLSNPFDDTIGLSILKSARSQFGDDFHTLLMFQNVMASSPGSNRYIFATVDEDPDAAIPLQHYNRCFIVKDKTPGSYHLQIATAKVITEAQIKKRQKDNLRPQQHDPTAVEILKVNGIDITSLPSNKEAQVVKIPGIDDTWYLLTDNSDLHEMSQERIDEILDSLDYNKYLALLHNSFEENWRNMTPEWEQKEAADKLAAKEANKNKPANLFDDVPEIASDSTVNHTIDTGVDNDIPDTHTDNASMSDIPASDVLTDTAIPNQTAPEQATPGVPVASNLFDGIPEITQEEIDAWQNERVAEAEFDREADERFHREHHNEHVGGSACAKEQSSETTDASEEEHLEFLPPIDDTTDKEKTDESEVPFGDLPVLPENPTAEQIMDHNSILMEHNNFIGTLPIAEGQDTSPLPLSAIDLPVMIPLVKTVISGTDIKKAEKCLAMNGIREIDTHKVLNLVVKALTDTDIG